MFLGSLGGDRKGDRARENKYTAAMIKNIGVTWRLVGSPDLSLQ
jgi:hypothetical protein